MCLQEQMEGWRTGYPFARAGQKVFKSSPVEVDIEDVKEPVPALSVAVTSNRVEEVGDDNVSSDDGLRRRRQWDEVSSARIECDRTSAVPAQKRARLGFLLTRLGSVYSR